MEKLIYFWKGYIKIRIRGEQTERFLNLCKGRNICVRKLFRHPDGELTGIIAIRDFFLLGPLHRKTRVRIHIVEKHGMPFFFYRSKKRKAFFVGIILCMLFLHLCTGRLWEIDVEGNVRNSTPEILGFLEQQGIVHGMARSQISCSEIAAELRKKYSDITWVSAKLDGTRLLLTVKEGIFAESRNEVEENPCDITAEQDGEIVKMITRAGVPKKKAGDFCKKGELLVSGILELKNDSQEVIKYDAIHADADIYIKRQKAYYHEIPVLYKAEKMTGKEKKGGYIRVGNFYIGAGDQTKEGWKQMVEENKIYLTSSFCLPVSWGIISQKQYTMVRKEYSETEVRELAWRELQRYEEKLIQKGVQISANNVKIEVDHKICISKGFLEIIEKIGEETPVEIPEQPAERTTEDG